MKLMGMLFLLFLHSTISFADTLTVRLDGTGHYDNIQDAIGWSASGDVILVYPGIYYENIDCYGRDSLTIASLYLVNKNDSVIHQTVINGNKKGGCLTAFRGEQKLRIIGFTITNGMPTKDIYSELKNGGGIFLDEVSASVENCIIVRNCAKSGGGICCYDSDLFLKGTKIIRNQAFFNGGGILYGGDSLTFDTTDRCDIYLNAAMRGADFYTHEDAYPAKIVLDTVTVADPGPYHFLMLDGNSNPVDIQDLTFNHARIDDVNADLYVDPSGSDENSGLTSEDPLRTISFALLKIKSDSLKNNTIHLAEGIYSYSEGNLFPVGLKDNVTITGDNEENTIIDLDHSTFFCGNIAGMEEIVLKNMTIKNGYTDSLADGMYISYLNKCHHVRLDHVTIKDCQGHDHTIVLMVSNCDSVLLTNSSFLDNYATECISISNNPSEEKVCYAELSGCRISGTLPPRKPDYFNYSTGLQIYNNDIGDNWMTARIINCEFTDNRADKPDTGYFYAASTPGIQLQNKISVDIVNSTFGNNTTPYGVAGGLSNHGKAVVNIYNSVFYGNGEHQVSLYNADSTVQPGVYFYNSLVENGLEGIDNHDPEVAVVYYDTTNLEDPPGWLGEGNYPYSLAGLSPCINRGTLDLPAGIILPEFDLAGNARIEGEQIDIGAYEFDYAGLFEDPDNRKEEYLTVSPNPAGDKATIFFSEELIGKNIDLILCDLTGHLAVTIFSGKFTNSAFPWTPAIDGNPLKPGIYLLNVRSGGKYPGAVKVVKM